MVKVVSLLHHHRIGADRVLITTNILEAFRLAICSYTYQRNSRMTPIQSSFISVTGNLIMARRDNHASPGGCAHIFTARETAAIRLRSRHGAARHDGPWIHRGIVYFARINCTISSCLHFFLQPEACRKELPLSCREAREPQLRKRVKVAKKGLRGRNGNLSKGTLPRWKN